MRFFSIILLNLLLFTSMTNSHAAEQKSKALMITVGDSISAGFLANTSAVILASENKITSPPHPPHNIPEWKVRLAQLLNNKSTLSFGTGSNIQSHYVRLKDYLKIAEPELELESRNFAMAGAVAADLPGQAKDIINIWKTGEFQKVLYLTFLIGSNDACIDWNPGGTPEVEMAASIREFFKIISVIKQDQPIRVLVSSLPKIPDLGKREILDYPLSKDTTCEYRIKEKDKYCLPLVTWNTPEQYAASVQVIENKNKFLESITLELSKTYPQFDFIFSHSLFKREIKIEGLAKDCFHPNAKGQDELSALLWNDLPWFKNP